MRDFHEGAGDALRARMMPARRAALRGDADSEVLFGLALDRAPFVLYAPQSPPDIAIGPRIGLTKAVDLPWRYGLKGSPFLSRPFKTGAATQFLELKKNQSS